MADSWGWAGTVGQFLSETKDSWRDSMRAHHRHLTLQHPSTHQSTAWEEEHATLSRALVECCEAEPKAADWGLVFEYELPLEGGRRPDVVVLAGGSLIVLEFKSTEVPTQPQIDQVIGYARDLSDYHEATHGRSVTAVVVLPRADPQFASVHDGVVVSGSDGLGRYLFDGRGEGVIDLDAWLASAYLPLPTLVAAARRIFEHEPLPHVKRALSAGIPRTIDLLQQLVAKASSSDLRLVAFVTGVPGAGKTLVGLRVVYERSETNDLAIFLSGNGPLVAVLQDALQSRVFVRDLHSFIRTHGINEKPSGQHVIVFDEAQRAWDRGYMQAKRGVDRSEPDLLIEIGARVEDWSALVGLVGEGQEIFSGEEGGMAQWREAIENGGGQPWIVHCPPHLEDAFSDLPVTTHDELHLEATLRARRADEVHDWVGLVLKGSVSLAARRAARFFRDGFQMYLTRDIQDAKNYALSRYFASHPDARYGLVASSHATTAQSHGLDNSFLATRKVKVGRWFNAAQDDPESCCALDQLITEFQCQGLELDLPIVCWGEDFLWDGRAWQLTPKRRQYALREPETILENAYRVLLTRGRDGVVVWLPPEEKFDLTEHALLASGVRPLPDELETTGLVTNGNGGGA